MYTDLSPIDRLIYDKCVTLASMLGEITINAMQREFCLGYACASRMMSTMENEGIITQISADAAPGKSNGKLF